MASCNQFLFTFTVEILQLSLLLGVDLSFHTLPLCHHIDVINLFSAHFVSRRTYLQLVRLSLRVAIRLFTRRQWSGYMDFKSCSSFCFFGVIDSYHHTRVRWHKSLFVPRTKTVLDDTCHLRYFFSRHCATRSCTLFSYHCFSELNKALSCFLSSTGSSESICNASAVNRSGSIAFCYIL